MKFFLIISIMLFSNSSFAEPLCASNAKIISCIKIICHNTNNKASVCNLSIGEDPKKTCKNNKIIFEYNKLTCEFNCENEKSRCF